MSITLLVVTDGRGEYLTRTLASLDAMVTGPFATRVIHDDSGDPAYHEWLVDTFTGYTVVSTLNRSGFDGAMQSAWSWIEQHTTAPVVFATEDDFVFQRPVDLGPLATDVLTGRPYLVQMALRRQPWNDTERAAGGVVEQHPDAYTQIEAWGQKWLEHRQFFTTNPSLYRRSLCRMGWPQSAHSEGLFTRRLLKYGTPGVGLVGAVTGDNIRFGYLGGLTDTPWVEHIGLARVGRGY